MCKTCLTYSDRNQCEPYVSDTVTKPLSHLSLDNFDFQGLHYLMVLDTATKFCIVWSVHSLNTETMIKTLTNVFSEQGLPLSIKCDCGRNFFLTYSSSIVNTWASTFHSLVHTIIVETLQRERAIRTIKGLMKCCTMAKQLWRLALIEYLTTPLDNNTPSPLS